jgi:hypothetical protein
VKYRAGLEPPLAAVDADESGMSVLKDPYAVHGRGQPGAVGWYRVSFVVPERLGRFAHDGTPCGIESNFLGTWEIYTYSNGKPAALGKGNRDHLGYQRRTNLPANEWVSNSPMNAPKKGDRITIAILATSYPWGGGSPEGFALRHLRLGRRTSGAYVPFYHALFEVRNKLRTLQGDELKAYREKVKGPLSRLDAVFAAAETGQGGSFIQALVKARQDLNEAQKK